MKGLPDSFWGKLNADRTEWHPLEDHCADVAACCDGLLRRTLLGTRLARLGDIRAWSEAQLQRLGVLAALHDFGKYNIGFQNKAFFGRTPVAGHIAPILAALGDAFDRATQRELGAALAADELSSWCAGDDLRPLLLATLSHHGRPVTIGGKTISVSCWQRSRNLDPFAGIRHLVALCRKWYPAAWATDGDKLPANADFQHAWAGLLMLGDWLGSNPEFFPFSTSLEEDRMPFAKQRAELTLERLGMAVTRSESGTDPFRRIAPTFSPKPAQARLLAVPEFPEGTIAILEAETGSGKTEAALAHFVRLRELGAVDGMYFALPTRTAATQIYRRVCRAVESAFSTPRPPVVLGVPGYINVDAIEGVPLPHFEVLWPDEQADRWRGWAAEHSKRYLAGAIVVGTIDQALCSALQLSHAHLRATALLRQLLVVDEVHASDTYMNTILREVLSWHRRAGGHALLLSATLGSSARLRLAASGDKAGPAMPSMEEASELSYPALTIARPGQVPELIEIQRTRGAGKTVAIELAPIAGLPERVAAIALDAASGGARILIVRNTVGGCQETQQELERLALARDEAHLLFRCKGVSAPHHSRFAKADREVLDAAIEAEFGRNRPSGGLVAVATQTVEQSLDLDADLLITDLCPADVLLQRIGRLWRHERSRPPSCKPARAIVLVGEVRDLATFFRRHGEARGAHGIGTVYDDLRVLEATWRLLEARRTIEIPAENRLIVENTTHSDVLNRITDELGDAWRQHANWIAGHKQADRQLADKNLVPRRAFGEFSFPTGDLDRHIGTRLGTNDRLVRFAEPASGPFGQSISVLTIPGYFLQSSAPGAEELGEVVERISHGFVYRWGERLYRYDRLGLRQEE